MNRHIAYTVSFIISQKTKVVYIMQRVVHDLTRVNHGCLDIV